MTSSVAAPDRLPRMPINPLQRLRRSRILRLEQDLRRSRKEVERLRARLDVTRQPDDLGYVFVVTYGRAGSTLVQGILNSIPGYLIRGENRQILKLLWDYEKKGMHWRRQQRRKQESEGREPGSSDPTNPMFGIDNFPRPKAREAIRQLALATILRPEEDTRVTGFKEVLWADENTPAFVNWLRGVFPGARFVINTRDLGDVSQSAWWSRDPDNSFEELQRREQMLMDLRDQLGDAAYHIRYDEFTADPTTLRGLFEWLGEEFDEERVRSVLAVKHSYQPAWKERKEQREGAASEPETEPEPETDSAT